MGQRRTEPVRQMYGANAGDYAAQLKALEVPHIINRQTRPINSYWLITTRSPVLSSDATKLLDDDLKFAPQNATARALRDMTQPKLRPPRPSPARRRRSYCEILSSLRHATCSTFRRLIEPFGERPPVAVS